MCEYCEESKRIEENKDDNISMEIWGRHLYLNGKLFGTIFGRDFLINYCPMCGRRLAEYGSVEDKVKDGFKGFWDLINMKGDNNVKN